MFSSMIWGLGSNPTENSENPFQKRPTKKQLQIQERDILFQGNANE
jgi:hypothetical protein